jgi:flagellar assembly protein FliH
LSAETTIKAARFPTFVLAQELYEPPPPAPTPEDEAEVARAAAHAEGYARGLADGRAAALAEWTPKLSALAGALEGVATTARARAAQLAAEIEQALPRAIVLLARKVVERELTAGEDAVHEAAARVARRLTGIDAIAVRVAPEIAQALAAWLRETDAPARLDGVAVQPDASLERADWMIETVPGFLDGRLVTQLEEAWRALTEPAA